MIPCDSVHHKKEGGDLDPAWHSKKLAQGHGGKRVETTARALL